VSAGRAFRKAHEIAGLKTIVTLLVAQRGGSGQDR